MRMVRERYISHFIHGSASNDQNLMKDVNSFIAGVKSCVFLSIVNDSVLVSSIRSLDCSTDFKGPLTEIAAFLDDPSLPSVSSLISASSPLSSSYSSLLSSCSSEIPLSLICEEFISLLPDLSFSPASLLPVFSLLLPPTHSSASLPSPPSSPSTPLPPSAPTPSIPFEFYSRIPSKLPSTTESLHSPPRFSSSTSTEPSPPPILAFPRFHVSTIRTSGSAQATCFPAIPSTARRSTAIYSSISRGNTIPKSPRFLLRPIWSRFSAGTTRWTGTR